MIMHATYRLGIDSSLTQFVSVAANKLLTATQ